MLDRSVAEALDRDDPLALCRERFHLPVGGIYLDGNSLGPVPRAVPPRLRRVLEEEWGKDLISSWNRHGWIDLPRQVGEKIARLVGAGAGEVVVTDSVSINLFKLLAAALELRPERRVILCESNPFPTDLYVTRRLLELRGESFELRQVEPEELPAALDRDVAVLSLCHVDFRTGRRHDLAALTRAAHEQGALALWDLSHSAGAMPIGLEAAQVDLAVGCGYKFLNGGPGAPSFLYVARCHQQKARNPLAGWLGHRDPFAFASGYEPAPGVGRFLCGTPPILSLAALDAALEAFEGVDLAELRRKSLALGELFLERVKERCAGQGLEIACPEGEERGSQVSLRHEAGYAIVQALIARGVVGDFRAPDILRFGLAPLYLRYIDVWDAVEQLRAVLESGEWREERFLRRGVVT